MLLTAELRSAFPQITRSTLGHPVPIFGFLPLHIFHTPPYITPPVSIQSPSPTLSSKHSCAAGRDQHRPVRSRAGPRPDHVPISARGCPLWQNGSTGNRIKLRGNMKRIARMPPVWLDAMYGRGTRCGMQGRQPECLMQPPCNHDPAMFRENHMGEAWQAWFRLHLHQSARCIHNSRPRLVDRQLLPVTVSSPCLSHTLRVPFGPSG